MKERIEMREWNEYFKELLGEVEERVILGTYRGFREDGEELLGREEIKKELDKL